jgi:SlyX protein
VFGVKQKKGPSIMPTKDSLIELETKLAYQENLLEELNNIVCRQQDQIDELHLKLRSLQDKANELSTGVGPDGMEIEIPPHY